MGDTTNYRLGEEVLLNEIAVFKSGVSPTSMDFVENGELNYYKVSDMNNNNDRLIKSELQYNYFKDSIKSGSIIFPKRGASIFTNKIAILSEDGMIDTNLMAITLKRGNPEYIYQYLKFYQLHRIADTSSIPQINNSHFVGFKIPFPAIEKQNHYSKLLNDMDGLINSYTKQKELLEQKKKYYLNVIFNDKNGDYYRLGHTEDFVKLGDVADINYGYTPSTKEPLNFGGEYTWYSVSDMKSKYINKSERTLTDLSYKESKLINKNTLLMSFKLTLGKLSFTTVEAFSNEAIASISSNDVCISNEYLYYALSSVDISKYGSQAAQGITLNKDSLHSIEIALIEKDIRSQVVIFFSNIDKQIDYYKALKEVLEQKKKHYLNVIYNDKIINNNI